MGIEDIIAFALSGYVFLNSSFFTKDRMARLSGYETLFACGVCGLLLAILTVPISKWLNDGVGQLEFYKLIPQGILLAILGIPVAFLLAKLGNLWPRIDQFRLQRSRRFARETGDFIELLLGDAIEGKWYVEISLSSGKSYVGLPVRTVYLSTSGDADVELVPLFSGHRTRNSRELKLTRYYQDDLQKMIERQDSSVKKLTEDDFRVVVPRREIVSARLFDPEIFEKLNTNR